MPTEDELRERIRKTWAMAERAPDEIQLDAAVNALVRLATNKQFSNLIAPIMPPPVIDERADKLVVELYDVKSQLDDVNAENAQLRAEIERLNGKTDRRQPVTRTEPQVPVDKPKVKPRKTNFQPLVGKLVNAARKGGMKPGAIFTALNAFYHEFDGDFLTPNMIYGVRVRGDENDVILPPGDPSPLDRNEVMKMQEELWGPEKNITPMVRWLKTHAQPKHKVDDYMSSDDALSLLSGEQCATLRTRYFQELECRYRNPRYAKFARALSLLEKRTSRMSRHLDDRFTTGVIELAEKWFGPDDAQRCLAQLTGYDLRSVEQAGHGERKYPQELRKTVEVIASLVDDLDVDHPSFEKTVMQRVARYNRSTQTD